MSEAIIQQWGGKEKVLLCFEKYCDLNPDMKLTNSYHNFLNTFSQSKPEYIFHTIHQDECKLVYGKHIDEILPEYCEKWDINTVMFILLGEASCNPSLNTYNKLANLGISLCFHWPDTSPGWAIDTMYSLEQLADLHVSWDVPKSDFHSSLPKLSNHLSLWAPQDKNLYKFKPYEEKNKKAAFYGRPFLERKNHLEHIKSKLNGFHFGGGQREESLSPEEYADAVADTKIILNFPAHGSGFSQLKSRVIEAMVCGSLMLELENDSTPTFFEAGKDYISCSSVDDMITKAAYYLNNEEEAEKIALSGYNKYIKNHTGQHYWDLVFNNL